MMVPNGDVSWWWRDLGGVPEPRAALPSDLDVDVAIVGGGYTGLWTAYYLAAAQPDLRIAVLEQRFAGFGASGRNGGWLTNTVTGGRDRYGRAAGSALQLALNESVDEVVSVARREGIEADIVKGGELELARTPAQLARLRAAAAHDKLVSQHRDNVRTLVLLFDQYAVDPAFTKIERKQLSSLAAKFARELCTEGADDEIKAIYNRHANSDYDAEAAEEQAEQSRVMQEILEDHGFEFDAQYETLADLEAAARAQQAERTEAAGEARARRKKSARQQAAEERRTVATAQASKALQEVYRQLVRALHPDHERDPVERERKTALMQEVNVAYEKRDLLRLLELQLKFEQIDTAHIAGLAEDRLDHYIRLLNEQVTQLRDELAGVEHHFRIQLDVMPPTKLSAAYVLVRIREDTEALANNVAHMQQDLRTWQDPRGMKAWLRDQRDRAASDARELQELLAMFGEAPPPRRHRRR